MPVVEIKSLQQFHQIINGEKPVLIDFWATWCGPCRMISPVVEKMSDNQAFADKVDFYKVDVDAVPDVAQEVGIKAMPTFKLFFKGQQTDELVGADPGRLQALVTQAQSLL